MEMIFLFSLAPVLLNMSAKAISFSTNPYVPWDVNAIKQAAGVLRSNIGVIATIGLVGFLMISGIFAISYIVKLIIH